MPERKSLDSADLYNVGWIAALPSERAAATALLDERHEEPQGFSQNPADNNSYTWGRMGKHNVVIASLQLGFYGTSSAVTTASTLLSSLPHIRIGLLVGIGAGIPRPDSGIDIRLGDVVVSKPEGNTGGVVQYDLMKTKSHGVRERKDFLNAPSAVLLHALGNLRAEHHISESEIPELLENMWETNPRMAKSTKNSPGFIHQGVENDLLFKAVCDHVAGPDCSSCDKKELILREMRDSTDPEIHYGVIASGNNLIADAATRDKVLVDIGPECLCIEMEAAGVMNHFPCLVIRGISSYADSHKNDRWQLYAAATAAAFGKELLGYVPVKRLQETKRAAEVINSIKEEVQVIPSIAENTNTGDVKLLNWPSSLPSEEKRREFLSQYQKDTREHLLKTSTGKTILSQHGTDIEAKDDVALTALSMAAYYGKADIAEDLMKQGADIETTDENDTTPLQHAAAQGHTDVVKLCINHKANDNGGASGGGHTEVVRPLVENGADIDTRYPQGYSPLYLASCNNNVDIVKFLLKHGADLEVNDYDGRTALHAAAAGHNKREAYDLLVEKGTDTEVKDKDGVTPESIWGVYYSRLSNYHPLLIIPTPI
ncbi:Ankyrin-3 [Arthrobotrys entomopaga]|nr:Ankyrin-3 [Arthrobotrys entomopaga]